MPSPVSATPLDVSVVIPAFNRERLIGRSVFSALNQYPRPAAEVIVVDDGSSDRTAEIAEFLGARVVRQQNGGEGSARNAGVATSSSTWVAFLDSDDEWLPSHLDVLAPHLDGHVLAATSARSMPSGRLAGGSPSKTVTIGAANLLWPQSPLVPSATIVRRDVAHELGFRSLPTAADLDFFIRVLERGSGIVLPDVTVLYFEHEGQISTDNAELKRGRTQVLHDYEDRDWFPRGLFRDVEASDSWDAFRQAQRAHKWKQAATHVAEIAKPYAVRALVDVWRYRFAARHR
jgi:glycosyltransferase involved in cell wall biosynthesis